MKFRFKVLKSWEHILQCKRFLFWKDAYKDNEVRYVIHYHWYEDAEVLRYRPIYPKTDDDYRNFIKEITKAWNDHRKKVKERKKLQKTDYYIE